jgi:hypothetical protein
MIWLLIIYLGSLYITRRGIQKKVYMKNSINKSFELDKGDLLLTLCPAVNTFFGLAFILTELYDKIDCLINNKKFNLVEEFFKPREFSTAVRFQIGLVFLFIVFITILIIKFYNTYL